MIDIYIAQAGFVAANTNLDFLTLNSHWQEKHFIWYPQCDEVLMIVCSMSF